MDQAAHDRLKEQLFALYDGELPEADRPPLLAHLGDCTECRQLDKHWRAIATTFFRPPQQAAPAQLAARIMARLEPEASKPFWALDFRWLAPALGAALALLVLVVAQPGERTPPSTEALLLADGNDNGTTEWMLLREPADQDDLLAFVMEKS